MIQAVCLRIDQFVAVTQPQPPATRMVVICRLLVTRCPAGLQHQHDGVLHRVDGDDRGRWSRGAKIKGSNRLRGDEQIAQPLEAAFGAFANRRVTARCCGDGIVSARRPPGDRSEWMFLSSRPACFGADRTAQAHRAALCLSAISRVMLSDASSATNPRRRSARPEARSIRAARYAVPVCNAPRKGVSSLSCPAAGRGGRGSS